MVLNLFAEMVAIRSVPEGGGADETRGGRLIIGTKPWHKHYDCYVPATYRYPGIPAQDLISAPASFFPDRSAIDFHGTQMSFWELKQRMRRLANALGRLGVKKGDRIGVALPNCPQYVISYLAALSLGAIVVNLNPMYTRHELKLMLELTEPETLITYDGALPNLRPLALELGLKRVIVTRMTDFIKEFNVSTARSLDLEEGWLHFSSLIEETTDTRLPTVPFHPEDPALIQFTGGMTGIPKGAVLTHANIVASVYGSTLWGALVEKMTRPGARSVLGVIPYFHIYGFMSAMNWGFLNTATQVMLHRFDLEEVINTISKYKEITFYPAVPTMITAILNHPAAGDLNLEKHIQYLHSGGAPMPLELIAKINDMGLLFGEGYGMSESTALGIANPVSGLKKRGSIGIPHIGLDVRLVELKNGTEDVRPGDPGEIIMKGPSIMKGYWRDPEETAIQLKNGWFHTGDIARMDEDGYFYIVDRKKDMIIAGGFNIYPREVDEALLRHPKVSEAVSIGVPDDYRGETVKAFIVLKPGASVTAGEIIDFCKTRLAAYKVPKLVEFRDGLPKPAGGKHIRKHLREEEISKRRKQVGRDSEANQESSAAKTRTRRRIL